jgi:hypothetical protein
MINRELTAVLASTIDYFEYAKERVEQCEKRGWNFLG